MDIQQSKDLVAALTKAKVVHEFIVIEGAPHTFDLHPKGSGWVRVSLRWTASGQAARDETRSDRADVLAPTLAFLKRTIGK